MSIPLNAAWRHTVGSILNRGQQVSPRGKLTQELLQHTISCDMRYPVVTVKERKLSYKFMAAEAYWILSGDDRVDGIAPWNSHIASFSDDGKKFFGAYGPKIESQLNYVVDKLIADPDSRQAGLTIWRECPPETKDVPCTVAIFFNIRKNLLNVQVFMRSSDAWLGLPYDAFNFSMLGHLVCGKLNTYPGKLSNDRPITPGSLYLTAASSHLYDKNWDVASECLVAKTPMTSAETPVELALNPGVLMNYLKELRESHPGDLIRWWEV